MSEEGEELQTGKGCSTRSRCNDARNCDRCAASRQAKIAGLAERIEQEHGQLTMTVIKPAENTAAAIRAVHASFMRRALAPAGIWTIEQGEMFGGLHLNILSPAPKAARWKNITYSELLTCTAREAAAYIAKRKGMPAPEQYGGRLYGTFGKLSGLFVRPDMPPIIQGAAVEVALGGGKIMQAIERERKASTREEFRAVAMRNLEQLRKATQTMGAA